ncbi:MAG TPA: PEGA domain-containing protein, partial [Polyangiaceae bacterium]
MSATNLESINNSRDAVERAPSPPPATVVGLGPPEPPVAATAPYLAEGSDARAAIEKQTLVGFPGPAPDEELEPEPPSGALGLADSLADSTEDEVTVVGGYDDVTVVTPSSVPAVARLLSEAKPLTPHVPDSETDPALDAAFDPPTDAGFEGPAPDAELEAPPESATDAAGTAAVELRAEAAERPGKPGAEASSEAARDLPLDTQPPPIVGGASPVTSSASPEAVLASLVRASNVRASRPPPPPRPSRAPSRPETLPPPSSDRDLFVSRDTELQLFAPPIEMFGPGSAPRGRFDSIPPRNSPVPAVTQSDAPWYTPVEPEGPPARRPRARATLIGLVLAVVAAFAVFAGVLQPKSGRVLVTVSGPLDAPVSNAAVFVDGQRACEPAPCRVTVQRGAYVLSVTAPTYRRSADKSLSVSGGAEEAIHFTLQPDDSAGVEIKGAVAGLRVIVDGLDRGTTPVTVRGLAPGKHSLKLTGNARYAAFETELDLVADRVEPFEPNLTQLPEPAAVEAVALADVPKVSAAPAAAAPGAPVPAVPNL